MKEWFVKKLNKFWKQIEKDLNNKNNKIKIISYMFMILKETHIRVGNIKYYKNNNSVGLTTLKKSNIYLKNPSMVLLKFKGKSNVYHEISILNPKIVRFIKKICKNKKKSDWLFTNNNIRINSLDMNIYLKKNIGNEFKMKDFRTVSANIIFIDTIKQINDKYTINQSINKSLKTTAEKLGHNKSTSKKSYVSEEIINYYKNNRKQFIKSGTLKILKK